MTEKDSYARMCEESEARVAGWLRDERREARRDAIVFWLLTLGQATCFGAAAGGVIYMLGSVSP